MKLSFDDVIALGVKALKPGERWCIVHPDGPLEMTASLDMTAPVRLICEALDTDWDDLQEQGFRLDIIPSAKGDDGPSLL